MHLYVCYVASRVGFMGGATPGEERKRKRKSKSKSREGEGKGEGVGRA